jgi:hypothetical protein
MMPGGVAPAFLVGLAYSPERCNRQPQIAQRSPIKFSIRFIPTYFSSR